MNSAHRRTGRYLAYPDDDGPSALLPAQPLHQLNIVGLLPQRRPGAFLQRDGRLARVTQKVEPFRLVVDGLSGPQLVGEVQRFLSCVFRVVDCPEIAKLSGEDALGGEQRPREGIQALDHVALGAVPVQVSPLHLDISELGDVRDAESELRVGGVVGGYVDAPLHQTVSGEHLDLVGWSG